MTNEIKQIFQIAAKWQVSGKKTVLATVVHLEGSAYRRPGVSMIICNNGETFGAVSGGCIEKEIQQQAQSVFKSGKAKIMEYDGRLRLGCEGILYVLLEPFVVSAEMLEAFHAALDKRQPFKRESYYYPSVGEFKGIGSLLRINRQPYSLNPAFHPDQLTDQECFAQTCPPVFQLYIFGAEHDAVHLCKAAHLLGWEISIVASPEEDKSIGYFPGASQLITASFSDLDTSGIDGQTAVILMTHSFHKDVQYLIALKDVQAAYLGLLGPKQRRERVLSKFWDYCPDISPTFLEQISGPAGISIGAENPAEIAVSILAEILSTTRDQEPVALKHKAGRIHG
jgi:xanthine/CO dehydrogenase XdhC/CoxF family maturation factor